MNISKNNYDPIESLIFEHKLRIIGINFYPEVDLMLIVLSNKKVLKRSISQVSQLLAKAPEKELTNFELLGNGVAIHWPNLDEDLSLKGFLQNELVSLDTA
jgi:hypothetical protein